MADIDHCSPGFAGSSTRGIRDAHGHPAGDIVLKDVAHAMRNELRAFDLVYRVGGEEFAVLLPGARLEKTFEIAERLRMAVADCGTTGLSVTMSFGAAAVRGEGVRLAQVYAQADAALYDAKRAGRNRVALAAGPLMAAA